VDASQALPTELRFRQLLGYARIFLATMAPDAQRNRKTRKLLFLALLALICVVIVNAVFQSDRPWVIPEEVKKLKNPLQPSEAAMKAARGIYANECAQCHGERGKGDGPEAAMHSPAPTDLTYAAHMNSVTDGGIYYQISQGRKPMPSFKKRLSEEQRWGLVLLVRSFAAPSEVRKPTAPTSANVESKQVPVRSPKN
jgi:mono/diheme cytochrome c family protein